LAWRKIAAHGVNSDGQHKNLRQRISDDV